MRLINKIIKGLFGSSGIRAPVDREFFSLVFNISLSIGKHYSSVIIARDTRTSGDALKHMVLSGLCASGARVYDADILPTPVLAYSTRKYKAGIEITASHNPPEYNGLKLWNPDGSSFHEVQQAFIEAEILRDAGDVDWRRMTKVQAADNCLEEYLNRVKEDFPQELGIKVVVDCGGGATSLITPSFLQELGCDVVALNSLPTGFFPRGSEPVEENLSGLRKAVLARWADLGIAHDGDGDRMVAMDEKGRIVEGDKMLLILAEALGAKKVVTTVDATMLLEKRGLEVRRTRVGDTFVSEKLREGGDFGGEAAGSWIFPKVSLCPDGVYAAAKIAQIVSKKKLSALADEISLYPIKRGSVTLDMDRWPDVEKRFSETDCLSRNKEDGIKLNFSDGWLLLRPSGTEPKLRITVEAQNKKRAQEIYNMAQKTLSEFLRNSL